jgi:hypothetical protein
VTQAVGHPTPTCVSSLLSYLQNSRHTLIKKAISSQLNVDRVRAKVTVGRAVYRQSVLAARPLEANGQRFFFSTEPLHHSSYVASSLTRRRICPLQLLLALASALNLGSQSRGKARPLYLYPPETGWASYTLRHWVPFSSHATTCVWRKYSNSSSMR